MPFIFSLFTLLGVILALLGLDGLPNHPAQIESAMISFGLLLVVVGVLGLFIDRLFDRMRIDRRTNRIVRDP